MSITDIPQDNIISFPIPGGDEQPPRLISFEGDRILSNNICEASTIAALLRNVASGMKHYAERAWLIDELKKRIPVIRSQIGASQISPFGYGRRLFCDQLKAIDMAIMLLDETLGNDRHEALWANLTAYLQQQIIVVDALLTRLLDEWDEKYGEALAEEEGVQ